MLVTFRLWLFVVSCEKWCRNPTETILDSLDICNKDTPWNILNSDFPWLWSPETKNKAFSHSARPNLHMSIHIFFTACTVCVRVLSCRKDKPLNTSTNNKNSVSWHRSPEISFFSIHSIRCERQRTRRPCLVSASVQHFLLFCFFFFKSLQHLCTESVRVHPILKEPRSDCCFAKWAGNKHGS